MNDLTWRRTGVKCDTPGGEDRQGEAKVQYHLGNTCTSSSHNHTGECSLNFDFIASDLNLIRLNVPYPYKVSGTMKASLTCVELTWRVTPGDRRQSCLLCL